MGCRMNARYPIPSSSQGNTFHSMICVLSALHTRLSLVSTSQLHAPAQLPSQPQKLHSMYHNVALEAGNRLPGPLPLSDHSEFFKL